MCEGGREVSRGGDGARLLVELGCDHDNHDNQDDPVRGSLKESLAIEKYIVLNMQDPDQYFLGILVRFPNWHASWASWLRNLTFWYWHQSMINSTQEDPCLARQDKGALRKGWGGRSATSILVFDLPSIIVLQGDCWYCCHAGYHHRCNHYQYGHPCHIFGRNFHFLIM